METNLKKYFKELKETYKNRVKLNENGKSHVSLDGIPEVLHPLYQMLESAIFPFGRIYTIEEALKQSNRDPFKPDWFVFGRDNYFSFWLCAYQKDVDGLSFTYWDHESGNEIDGAVWSDLTSFLKEIEEEFNE